VEKEEKRKEKKRREKKIGEERGGPLLSRGRKRKEKKE
jgi:hypothetical protein